MRKIGVVTGGRSDYSILLSVLRRLQADPAFQLHLIVTGMHLSVEFGFTIDEIERDGFQISDRVDLIFSSDSPEGIAKSIGLGLIGFAQSYARFRPDLLLVAGDRFEIAAAVLAALPFNIPVAHLHGGEITEGAMDDPLRHSITKMSHLHFTSTQEYARRLIQMGEEPWRVVVSGAPALDQLKTVQLMNKKPLEEKFRLKLPSAPLLVTFHPVTLEYEKTEWQTKELLEALATFSVPIIFTQPNADTHGRVIHQMIQSFVKNHANAQFVPSLGTQGYWSVMAMAAAIVGNSSSGILEAPSFGIPAVNIGTRQQGRIRARNVIDVGYPRREIVAGIQKAVSPEFRATLRDRVNPYGDGTASEKIVSRLKEIPFDRRLIAKRFVDLAPSWDKIDSSKRLLNVK